MPKVSIIIRAKNEERWIPACLKAIRKQTFQDFEVILVDNHSTDRTVEKAEKFNVRLLTISDYRPGKAINLAVRESKGEFLVCLSAHCIPKNEFWLENLLKNFSDPKIAGVYGRQEPMSSTSAQDKRDLLITFGLDRRVQVKDSFFHNANSMIRRSVWDQIPFDDEVTNIEDRVWGQAVISKGLFLAYEPEASVYHYHGIHQKGNEERCRNVVKVLESAGLVADNGFEMLEDMNVVAFIPVKGEAMELCDKPLLAYTLERARQSRYIKKVIVSTDSPKVAEYVATAGGEAPFLRPPELSRPEVGIETVFKYTLEQLEKRGEWPDVVVTLNSQFPFRHPALLDDLLRLHFSKGFDSVFSGVPTFRSCWSEAKEGNLKRIDQGFQPHAVKNPVHVGYVGLGCVTYPSLIREGRLLGDNVGILEVLDAYSTIEVKDDASLNLARKLMPEWWRAHSGAVEKSGKKASVV